MSFLVSHPDGLLLTEQKCSSVGDVGREGGEFVGSEGSG